MSSSTTPQAITSHVMPGSFVMPRTEEEYDGAVAKLYQLLDEVAGSPDDPRQRLIETLSVLIKAYDDRHYPMAKASSTEVLRFLMEQHGLAEDQLPELGDQKVVAKILSGHWQLNNQQIAALAERFGVRPGVFMQDGSVRNPEP